MSRVHFTLDGFDPIAIEIDAPELQMHIFMLEYTKAIEIIAASITRTCKALLVGEGMDPESVNTITSIRMNAWQYPEIQHIAGNIIMILADEHTDDADRLYEIMDIYGHYMSVLHDENTWRRGFRAPL